MNLARCVALLGAVCMVLPQDVDVRKSTIMGGVARSDGQYNGGPPPAGGMFGAPSGPAGYGFQQQF